MRHGPLEVKAPIDFVKWPQPLLPHRAEGGIYEAESCIGKAQDPNRHPTLGTAWVWPGRGALSGPVKWGGDLDLLASRTVEVR